MGSIRLRHAVTGFCLLPLAGLVGGCHVSVGKTLDNTTLEQQITDAQKGQTSLPVTGATCPSNITPKVGATFTCTVSVDSVVVTYGVNIDSISGGKAHFHFQPINPIIDTGKIVASVTQQLGAGATADCGKRVQQVPADSIITCTVSQGGQSQPLQFKVSADSTVHVVDNGSTTTTAGS